MAVVDPVVDIMVTHDWPAGITDYGDVKQLLRLKPYFEEDLKKNAIGNPVAMTLLHVSSVPGRLQHNFKLKLGLMKS